MLDVGCGRGELLVQLAAHADRVVGNDSNAGMRAEATKRCAGLDNVSVVDGRWDELAGPFDVVTMIAVLHHLDVERALSHLTGLLDPGGKFLAVGLARPESWRDYLWEAVCIVTNPIIGYVKHPWPTSTAKGPPPFPVRDPELSLDELRGVLDRTMPGANVRRHLGFRHTIEWSSPPRG